MNLHVEPVRSEALDEHACMCTCTCTSNSGDLTDTCSIGHISKLVHAQIDSYLGTQDHDYDELNVDEQIANIEPQLWNAMCRIYI